MVNGEWPPYMSKDLKHNRVASRIVTDAFALVDIKAEYGFYPWKRSLNLAKTGRWDGSVVWSKNGDRLKYFYFSNPVINDKSVFFHLKDFVFDWKKYEDLKGIKIGGTNGYNYDADFHKYQKNGTLLVEYVTSDETNFKKLLKGRIKIFVCNLEVGYSLLYKLFPAETVSLFMNHPKTVKNSEMGLILSKKDKKNLKRIKLFNKGLEKLRRSGEVDRFLDESRRGEYKKR